MVAVTRDCALDHGTTTNQTATNVIDAYGLYWQVEAARTFGSFLDRYNNRTGLNQRFRMRPFADYIQNWVEVWPTSANPGPNDWWLLGAEVFAEDIGQGAFVDLTRILQQDRSFGLTDIPAAFRNAGSSAYAGAYSVLPLWLTAYQRRDVFEVHNITPPATWEAAIAIAEEYGNGKLGPGQPQLGFCFESNPACGYAHAIVIHILASMVQLRGPSDGAWFDPATMEPLYQGEAFREALRIFTTLRAHTVPDNTTCLQVYNDLASGRCLMMWGFSYGFKRAAHTSSPIHGRQGVARTPGSARGLDRRTGRLQPCTKELCPYASNTTDPRTGLAVLVNHVVPLDSAAFAINAHAPVHRQAAAYMMLHEYTSFEEHTKVMLLPKTEVTPMRYSQLDEELWVGAGYDRGDVQAFLQVYKDSFASQNTYYELRIPGVFQIYTMMHNTVIKALYTNATVDELIAYAVAGTEAIFAKAGGRPRLLDFYQRSLDYTPPPPPPPGVKSDDTTFKLEVALVPALAALVVLSAALWGFLHWRRVEGDRRARLNAAPGANPNTTLLVTDIQDSTCLWESLPAEVMDAAVKVHSRVIRELLLPHHGYESATEGDSFLLSFHKPDGALSFALAAQNALMAADWPPQLMESTYAATMCVRHDAGAWETFSACLTAPQLQDAVTSAAATDAVPPRGRSSTERREKPPNPSTQNSGKLCLVNSDDAEGYKVAAIAALREATWSGPSPFTAAAASDVVAQPGSPYDTGGRPAGRRMSLERVIHSIAAKASRKSLWPAAASLGVQAPGSGSGAPRVISSVEATVSVGDLASGLTSGNSNGADTAPANGGTLFNDLYGSGGVRSGGVSGTLPCVGGGCAPVALREVLQLTFPGLPAAQQSAIGSGGSILGSGNTIFRGLRVRMGLHCGLSGEAEVQYNRASGRITYPGPTMHMTKMVSDVGRGGNILLSARVARALDTKALHAGVYILMAGGRHVLKEGEPAEELFVVFSRALLPRAGHLEPPRSVEEKVPGVLRAPLGRVTVAFVQFQDAEDFTGWGLESSLGTHRALLQHAGALAGKHGGYLVATAPGSFQAVFAAPAASVNWLLDLQDMMAPAMRQDMGGDGRTSVSGSMDSGDAAIKLHRATAVARLSILHLKGGVDVGPMLASLREGGGMVYAGPAAKRAACLAANTAWQEVLVSLEVARAITGESLPKVSNLQGKSAKRRISVSNWRPPSIPQARPPSGGPWRAESSQSNSGALPVSSRLPFPAKAELPRVAFASGSGTPGGVNLLFGQEVRVVKWKGAMIDACLVKLGVHTPLAPGGAADGMDLPVALAVGV